jgi:hypothetical protein
MENKLKSSLKNLILINSIGSFYHIKTRGCIVNIALYLLQAQAAEFEQIRLLNGLLNNPAFNDLLGEKGSLLTHQQNKYHQISVETGKSFLVNYHTPDLNISNQVCKQR